MKILVIGQYCWGKGDTEEEAKLKARRSGGKEGIRRYARLRSVGRDLGG